MQLSAKYGTTTLYDTILILVEQPDFSNDSLWLLGHLVSDGPANFAKLFRGHLFIKIASQLSELTEQDHDLQFETVCRTV